MKTVVKEIKSVKKNIKEIEDVLLEVNKTFCLPTEEYNKLMIAVTEVVMNAIIHGNKLDEKKIVRMTIDYDDKMMKVTVLDEGNGFNSDSTPDPTTMENILKSSGRGIFIVKSLIDDVQFKRTEKGSEIIITIKKKK